MKEYVNNVKDKVYYNAIANQLQIRKHAYQNSGAHVMVMDCGKVQRSSTMLPAQVHIELCLVFGECLEYRYLGITEK